MPDNMWMLLGLGALAVWALNRGNGEDPAGGGGLGALVGSAMDSVGVGQPQSLPGPQGNPFGFERILYGAGAIDSTSPASIILIDSNGDMREGPPQGVPASVAGDEDIGVAPYSRPPAPYSRFGQPPEVQEPPMAQDPPPVIVSPPKTSSPYKFNISPDYLLTPLAGQTITTPVEEFGGTTIQIIESPVAAHAFHMLSGISHHRYHRQDGR